MPTSWENQFIPEDAVAGAGVGPFLADDGNAGAPAYSFNLNPNTGAFRAGADIYAISTGGVEAVRWNASQQTLVPDGAVATPSYSFVNSANTGLFWRAGITSLAIGVSGNEVLRITAGQRLEASVNGTAASPYFVSGSDTDTGIVWTLGGANTFSISTGGVEAARWNASQQTLAIDGAVGAPAYAFINRANTGMYSSAVGIVSISITGVEFLKIWDDGGSARIIGTPASEGLPNGFFNDVDTGPFQQAADNWAVSCGGIEAFRVEDSADLGASETSLWLYDLDNGQMEQVTVGAAGSGGGAFKLLRVPN